MDFPRAPLEALTQINLADFSAALGLERFRAAESLVRWLFRPAAERFARQILELDARFARDGWRTGAAWLLYQNIAELKIYGVEHIPAQGPVLLLANHPGLSDTLALFASLPRDDWRILALDRPFLQAMSNASARIIYVPQAEEARMPVARAVSKHLKAGGAVLTFPAGEIEPDPAVMGPAAAKQSLTRWSESIGVFARLAPETVIVPALISGVLSPPAQTNPLVRLRRDQKDREKLAATLQILLKHYQRITVRIHYGPPLRAADLLRANPDPAAVTRTVVEQMSGLIDGATTEQRLSTNERR